MGPYHRTERISRPLRKALTMDSWQRSHAEAGRTGNTEGKTGRTWFQITDYVFLRPLASTFGPLVLSQRPIQQDFQVGRDKEAFILPHPLGSSGGTCIHPPPNSFRVLGETNVTLSNSGLTWLSLAMGDPWTDLKKFLCWASLLSVFGLNLLPYVCPDITPGLPTNTKIMLAKGLSGIYCTWHMTASKWNFLVARDLPLQICYWYYKLL